ncbi:MAG: phosphatidate cytidylyltransferase [Candidatus Thalassarchaeaceae archaeon]|jgi:phosphatidate cytidylyltransferase|nr:phosphatidate cytidylyltransferase [Candidatus Thalassarchaeaceae archaeon]
MDLGIENEALALAAPPMLAFVGVMYGILVLLSLAKWKSHSETLKNIWTRSLVATPLLFMIMASMEYGPLAWGFIIGVFALAAHREYCIAINLNEKYMQAIGAVVLMLLMVGGMTHQKTELGWSGMGGSGWLALSLLVAIIGTWSIPIIQDRSEGTTEQFGRAIIGFILGWLFLHGTFLLHLGEIGTGAAIFTVIVVAMTDSFALITGRIIGRHKFRPILSPKKTWEGVFGGVIAAAIAGYVAQPLLPTLSSVEAAVLGAVLAIIGTMGDLSLSMLKRDLGLKDWSSALPGHGGILDRVDSFILAAPACYWILMIIG